MELDINSNLVDRKFIESDYNRVKTVQLRFYDLRTSLKKRQRRHYLTSLLTVILCAAIMFYCYSTTLTNACDFSSCGNVTESAYYYPKSTIIKHSIDKKFLISNKHFCRLHNPYLLVIIPSRTGKFHVRKTIRETYGSMSRDNVPEVRGRKIDVVVRTLFVLGKSSNKTLEKLIFQEHMSHRDTLQIDIDDSYYNLTAKMLHALKWVNLYCSHVTFILKADEDVFVNIGILLEQLRLTTLSNTGNIFGRIFDSSDHLGVYRTGKWGVSYEEYPLNRYPPYAQGTSYTLTGNLVSKIVHSAQHFPYIHIEDVFITGIVSGRIHGAVLTKLNKTSDWGDARPNPCTFAKDMRLAQHKMTVHLMRQIWKALMSFTLTCETYRGRAMKH